MAACEVAAQLGHKSCDYRTAELYAAFDPAYLENALRAIDLLFERLCANSAPVNEPFFRVVPRQRTDFIWKSGAGEGIRTPDPNLGKVKTISFQMLPRRLQMFLGIDRQTNSDAFFGSVRSSTFPDLLPWRFPHASPTPDSNGGSNREAEEFGSRRRSAREPYRCRRSRSELLMLSGLIGRGRMCSFGITATVR